MYRGNAAAVNAAAEKIIEDLRSGAVTVESSMRQYRVAYPTLMRVVRPLIPADEWADIVRRNRARGGGKAYRFPKGHRAWNKGRKGWCAEGSRATQFKAGELHGQAAKKWRPIGTVVTRRDSPLPPRAYLGKRTGRRPNGKRRRWIKVRDDGPPNERWSPLARYIWAQFRGPIAEGLSVMHLDGDALNDALENLTLVDMAGRLALQLRINPEQFRRLRSQRAREAATYRHQINRERAKKEGPKRTVWYCPACGHAVEARKRPERCAKCGGYAKEKILLRIREAV